MKLIAGYLVTSSGEFVLPGSSIESIVETESSLGKELLVKEERCGDLQLLALAFIKNLDEAISSSARSGFVNHWSRGATSSSEVMSLQSQVSPVRAYRS
jgi:hypothetical protein